MAVDKGKQFEYAIMLAAYNRLPKPLPQEVKPIYDNIMRVTNKGTVITSEVKLAAKNMMNKIEPNGEDAKRKFYASFRQLGGGAGGGGEPKTDVMFVKLGKKYKCSLKWGDSYQLSSAGISKTTEVLKKVLAKTKLQSNTKEEIASVLTELENTLGKLPKIGEQSVVKKVLQDNEELKGRLEQIIGTRKNTQVAESFRSFKEAVVRESITGELLFGKSNDATANYILNEKELKPIDATLVKKVAEKTYVRLRLKGRGKTSDGVRLNELVITIEPK